MSPHQSEQNSFSRFSVKFGPTQLLTMPSSNGLDPRVMHGAASSLATDKSPTTQQVPSSTAALDAYFSYRPQHADIWAVLVALIAVAKITAAAKSLGHHETCHPDWLPNYWYKDHIDKASPIHEAVFCQCLTDSNLLPSFSHAMLFCIPTRSKLTFGLGFRPIALMNTDFKLLAGSCSRALRR